MDVLAIINQRKEIDDVALAHWVELGKIKAINIQGEVVPSASVENSDFEFYKLLDDLSVPPLVLLYNPEDFKLVEKSILPLKYGFQRYDSNKHDTFAPAFIHPITKLKWIHNIEGLKQKLQDVNCFEDLQAKQYDVDSYYLYNLKENDTRSLEYFRWLELRTNIPILTNEYIKIHTITNFNLENLKIDIQLNYPKLDTSIFKHSNQATIITKVSEEVCKSIGHDEVIIAILRANDNENAADNKLKTTLITLNKLKETKNE